VTGSCFELALRDRHLLIDCGLFQGPRSLEALNYQPLAFDAARLEAVLLTHAHLDHSGLLPRLVAEGFRGIIYCTGATLDLLAIMLADAAKLQEQDAARRNRRPDRADQPPILPLYSIGDAEAAVALAQPCELAKPFDVVPGITATFWNAGHSLGSASIEIVAGESRLLFSGDLGPDNKSFHLDPVGPQGFDHILCESTYGDRSREATTILQRRATLEAEVRTALDRGGNLIIPAFALERTQELLLDLARLIDTGRLPGLRVFIDSPLASRATAVFRDHRSELEDLGEEDVFRHPHFHFVESVDQSRALNTISGAVILSASGMCEGGRVRHHLQHNLPRWDSTVLFVGFQAGGTLGRTILEGAERVRISGRDVAVRAHIRQIESYSAHADREELIAWVEARKPIAGSLFIVHGEPEAAEGLKAACVGAAAAVVVPELGERYALTPKAAARRLATGRADLKGALGRDWQNEYADFAVGLKRELQRIGSDRARKRAIARMRAILDSMANFDATRPRRGGTARMPGSPGLRATVRDGKRKTRH
jgi:metallo-beta-lactamase family protein